MTGQGVDEFFEAVKEKADEFNRDYKPELERRRQKRDDDKNASREKELGKLMKDMAVSTKPPSKKAEPEEEEQKVPKSHRPKHTERRAA